MEWCSLQVIQQIQNGELLDCPRLCPEDVYKIMLRCWRRQPAERQNMREISQQLTELYETQKSLNYLEILA